MKENFAEYSTHEYRYSASQPDRRLTSIHARETAMYQLTIAAGEGVHTTCHAEPEQASRALLDYAIKADLYLLGDGLPGDRASSATDLTVITLLQLDPSAGRQPRCVGTATITATASVAPTTNSLTGAAAS